MEENKLNVYVSASKHCYHGVYKKLEKMLGSHSSTTMESNSYYKTSYYLDDEEYDRKMLQNADLVVVVLSTLSNQDAHYTLGKGCYDEVNYAFDNSISVIFVEKENDNIIKNIVSYNKSRQLFDESHSLRVNKHFESNNDWSEFFKINSGLFERIKIRKEFTGYIKDILSEEEIYYEKYIGREMYGFKYSKENCTDKQLSILEKSLIHNKYYHMKKGKIIEYLKELELFVVRFDDDYILRYPTERTLQYLAGEVEELFPIY